MDTAKKTGTDTTTKRMDEQLNTLLANYTLFYMNVRGFHWNIRGNQFFELHRKFEELYGNLEEKIDEIAERILTLGHTPVHTFTDYLRMASMKECRNVSTANETVLEVLEGLQLLLSQQRELLEASAEAKDEGTNAMMSDYIREQEKLVWMFNAFLSAGGNTRPGQEEEAGAAN